jgi:hypothetical protein
MNTSKILDVVPQGTPAPAQHTTPPSRTPPQAVPALGDSATSDAVRNHAQRQAEAAAAEAERKRAAKAEPRPQNFNREVGLVGDTFDVFVDLVSSSLKNHRFRIFGPPDNPAPPPPVPTSDPASAHAAYSSGGAKPPVLKTDV